MKSQIAGTDRDILAQNQSEWNEKQDNYKQDILLGWADTQHTIHIRPGIQIQPDICLKYSRIRVIFTFLVKISKKRDFTHPSILCFNALKLHTK